jgi:uncharacterized membrane protein
MTTTLSRFIKHLSYAGWRVNRAFPKAARKAIAAEIGLSENRHDGELRFVVVGGLDLSHLWCGVSARQHAVEVFSQLRVWDTEHNSGVLIYVQLADRRVEIVADRGIHKKVGDATWQTICAGMQQAFRAGKFEDGALGGVRAVGGVLAKHFPAHDNNPDELSNEVVVM